MSRTYTLPPQSAVLDAFLDERRIVRDAALHWFAGVWIPTGDADLFEPSRRIVQAVEEYGVEAFEYVPTVAHVPWSPDSLARLVHTAFSKKWRPNDLGNVLSGVADVMPLSLYRQCGDEFVEACKRNDAFDKKMRKRFKTFDAAATETPDIWWARALAWCSANNERLAEDVAAFDALIDLLVDSGSGFVDRALGILADPNTVGFWEETLAILYLSKIGETRGLEPIVARLLDSDEGCELTFEAVEDVFGRFPADLVVRAFRRYPLSRLSERHVGMNLDCVRSAEAVSLAIDMAAECKDAEDAVWAIDSALGNLAPELVPAAVDFIENRDLGFGVDVIGRLESLVAFHNLDVPQLGKIRAELEAKERERHRQQMAPLQGFHNPLYAFIDSAPAFDEPPPQTEEDWQETDWHLEPAAENDEVTMPLKREATVGRNETCPCGSGKKYKKCCLAAQSQK